ncbi:Hypothetical protein LUCI_3471 [Lucifera butyrica]|uniref:PRD domain-containing protein n=1 Tax=Lucifera butyrica TaxID=1351585 RepID=A0A498RDJ0_9FIRM|nr:PRD domain-containing protein [Lucifera butyrica]VBB08202.1 Hypothetical protein LUCI_3471 [Lucifera butyrica]
MRVKQRLNNNAIVIYDEQNDTEKIAIGKGLGFQSRINERIDSAQIEKLFIIENKITYSKFAQILKSIPEEYITLSEEIISHAEEILKSALNIHIHISLTDHIAFAIERLRAGIPINNKLLTEIKILYKEEYAIGQWAKQRIEDKLHMSIPEDEAGFIALHIHSAKLNQSEISSSLRIPTIIKGVIDLIEKDFRIRIDDQTIAYHRLITHLQFTLQRLNSGQTLHEIDQDIFMIIQQKYQREFACAIKIGLYLKKEYGISLPEAELGYMSMHIKTITSRTGD